MPVDPITASRTSRANALRIQRLVSNARAQEMLPNEEAAQQHGRPQAKKSAAALGVGDNQREALDDLYTRDQPKAPAWTSELSQDSVTGNGDIEPQYAFADVPMFVPGERAEVGSTVSDPARLATLTSELLAKAGDVAAQSHRTGGSGSDQ